MLKDVEKTIEKTEWDDRFGFMLFAVKKTRGNGTLFKALLRGFVKTGRQLTKKFETYEAHK